MREIGKRSLLLILVLEFLGEAIACFREFDWPWEIGQTLLEMAQVLIARDQPGDLNQARNYLQEAYQAFDAISARPMREKTESMLASMPAA